MPRYKLREDFDSSKINLLADGEFVKDFTEFKFAEHYLSWTLLLPDTKIRAIAKDYKEDYDKQCDIIDNL